jgi:hypothetical protein
MKKSELRKIIKEEISKLNEIISPEEYYLGRRKWFGGKGFKKEKIKLEKAITRWALSHMPPTNADRADAFKEELEEWLIDYAKPIISDVVDNYKEY